MTRLALMATVETCWNAFPSTPTSSLVLLVAHCVVLGGIWTSKQPPATRASGGATMREGAENRRGVLRRRTARKSE